MNDKIKGAVAWQASQADFTPAMRQRLLEGLEQSRQAPRLQRLRRKKALLLLAAVLAALALAGFTAAALFHRVYQEAPAGYVFWGSEEYQAFVEELSVGEMGVLVRQEDGATVVYKYLVGDTVDIELFGEEGPDQGFTASIRYHENTGTPEILSSDLTASHYMPEDFRSRGIFSFSLENPSYRLTEVMESRGRLHSLDYQTPEGGSISIRASYGQYYDPQGHTRYTSQDVVVNGRPCMLLEIDYGSGSSYELHIYLGEEKLVPDVVLTGDVPMEELLKAAQALVLYNEAANRPDAVPVAADDVFSHNPDPLISRHSQTIFEAARKEMDSGNGGAIWSREGREVTVNPELYALYQTSITYTPEAWREAGAAYGIPNPPLNAYGWSPELPMHSVAVNYRQDRLESVYFYYAASSGSYHVLHAYPLADYRPQTQLDASLLALWLAVGVGLPEKLYQEDGIYYITNTDEELGELYIYTSIYGDGEAWGFRYMHGLLS